DLKQGLQGYILVAREDYVDGFVAFECDQSVFQRIGRYGLAIHDDFAGFADADGDGGGLQVLGGGGAGQIHVDPGPCDHPHGDDDEEHQQEHHDVDHRNDFDAGTVRI